MWYALALALTLADAAHTRWLLKRQAGAELNPLINWISQRWGTDMGLLIGVLGVGAIIGAVLNTYWRDGLIFYVGMRAMLVYLQSLARKLFSPTALASPQRWSLRAKKFSKESL